MDRVILLQFGGSVNVLTMNPNPYWVTAGRGSPTSRAPLKVSIWCTQTRLTASPPHMYDNVYLYVAYVYMSSIFSLINKYQKFASYLAAIRDRWDPRYGHKHNLQARPISMDGHASTHLLLHSGVALSCPCGALVWWAAHCCRATRDNESEFAQVLLIKESDNEKTVCNPTLEADSPTQHGSHICTQVGYGHDGYLLCPSPHLSLVVDFVMEELNV
jgi:hypothetical protein